MFELDDNLVIDFLDESREQLVAVEADLVAMEAEGAHLDEKRLDRIFRSIHRVKAGSDLFDFAKIGELAHRVEEALAPIRSRKLAPGQESVSALVRAVDRLRLLVDHAETSNDADIAAPMAELDRLCADPGTPGRITGASQGSQPHRDAAPLRVLLVEDDFASRLLLHTFLSRYGECHIAVNGREAVEAFRSALERGQGYDLICMDILMPEMDGRAAVSQMRAIEQARRIEFNRGARIFMTTTLSSLKEVALCFRELCDAYLVKPVDLARLLSQMKMHQLVR
ncbi:MAG: response regulator [Terracidiphilus sp.]